MHLVLALITRRPRELARDTDRVPLRDRPNLLVLLREAPAPRACFRPVARKLAPASDGAVVASHDFGSQPARPTWQRRTPLSWGYLLLYRHSVPRDVRPSTVHRPGGPAGPCAGTPRQSSGGSLMTAHQATSLRQRGCCGPCGDGRTGSRDRRGCASGDGSRAPCDDDGCSAGTYACS